MLDGDTFACLFVVGFPDERVGTFADLPAEGVSTYLRTACGSKLSLDLLVILLLTRLGPVLLLDLLNFSQTSLMRVVTLHHLLLVVFKSFSVLLDFPCE